jgi:hypothetical protein
VKPHVWAFIGKKRNHKGGTFKWYRCEECKQVIDTNSIDPEWDTPEKVKHEFSEVDPDMFEDCELQLLNWVHES